MTACGALVCSAAQSRNALRKPWTVARSARPVFRSTCVKVMSDIGWPCFTDDGNIRPLPSDRGRARSSTSCAASLSGTRCSVPLFMRSPGMRHSHVPVSSSFHVAPRASPDRAAVSTRKRRHSLLARDALEASTTASAAATS